MQRQEGRVTGRRILEIRTYRLEEGKRADFDRIFRDEALPMLRRHGIEVVGFGPSIEDGVHFVLIRAFPTREARNEQEAEFYGSDEWRSGPREAILAPILSYHTVVLETTAEVVEALTTSMIRQPA
jgi:hypothetical protein